MDLGMCTSFDHLTGGTRVLAVMLTLGKVHPECATAAEALERFHNAIKGVLRATPASVTSVRVWAWGDAVVFERGQSTASFRCVQHRSGLVSGDWCCAQVLRCT